MKSITYSRRFWIVLSVTALVGMAIYLYFSTYVKHREKEFIRNKFTALKRIGQNLKAGRENSIHKFRIEIAEKIYEPIINALRSNSISSTNIEYIIHNYNDSSHLEGKDPFCDSLNAYRKKKLKYFSDSVHISINAKDPKHRQEVAEVMSLLKFFFPGERIWFQSIDNEAFLNYHQIETKPYFSEFAIIKVLKNNSGANNASEFNRVKQDIQNDQSHLSTNIVINQATQKTSSPFSLAYQTFNNKLKLNLVDSLFRNTSGIYSSRVITTDINGISYLVQTHRIDFDEDEEWILCGFTKEVDFTRDTRKINLYLGLIITFTLVAALLSMPLLKLLVMSPKERLQISNVWFVGFAIVVGAAALTILSIFVFDNLGRKQEMDKNLHRLGQQIDTTFQHEINSMLGTIDTLNADNLYSSNPSINQENYFLSLKPLVDILSLSKLKNTLRYPNFSELLWIKGSGDDKGKIARYLENDEQLLQSKLSNTLQSDLSERNYYKRVIQNPFELWHFPSDKKKNQFTIESVRSWSSGRNMAAVSIPIKIDGEPGVLAMLSNFKSLIDTWMPPGYSFCVVDNGTEGNVWFHSNTKLNNQESLYEDLDGAGLVRSAVHGRDTISLDVTYKGSLKRCYVMPIAHTSLSLILFYDMQYFHNPIDNTAALSSAYIFIMFLLIGIQLVLLFGTTYKPTRLSIKRFFLSWLRPKVDDTPSVVDGVTTMLPSIKYKRSILYLTGLIITMALLIITIKDTWLNVCFIVLPLYVLPFHFTLYKRESILSEKEINARASWHAILHPFHYASFLLLVFINLLSLKFLDSWLILISVVVQIIFVAWGWACLSIKSTETITKWISVEYPKSYRVSLLLWLVLVSILAPIYFYKSAYYTENTIAKRYELLEAARSKFDRNQLLSKRELKNPFFQSSTENDFGSYAKLFLSDSTFESENEANSSFDEILFRNDPFISESARQAIFPSTYDDVWSWWPIREKNGKRIVLDYRTFNGDSIQLSAVIPDLSITNFSGNYWPVMLVTIILLMIFFILLVRFAVKHIFGIGWLNTDSTTPLNEEWTKVTKLFVIGLPFSGKLEWAKANVLNGKNSSILIDLRDSTSWYSYYGVKEDSTVMIRHFEYGINSHSINELKLNLLNEVVRRNPAQLIILSAVQPVVLLDFYDRQLSELNSTKDREEFSKYKHAVRYWRNLLSGFVHYYKSLHPSNAIKNSPDVTIDSHHKWFLNSELAHGTYLPQFNPNVVDGELSIEQKEEVILQIEERAHNYYQSLWNSFSNSEKYLLYDLAKDRFVNFRNQKTIRLLIQKGVLTMTDSLRIMNRSFNNFILSIVKEDEEIKMNQELRRTGTWHIVQIVIVIVLLGLTVFMALANQDALTGMNAWVTAIAGAITLITRFGGLLSFTKKE